MIRFSQSSMEAAKYLRYNHYLQENVNCICGGIIHNLL
jgi:hypothetical protein